MKTKSTACEQILQGLESELCSGPKQDREIHWRQLVRSLRLRGRTPESVTDALTDLLGETGGTFARGASFASLHQEYHNLSSSEKGKVDQRYRECLNRAKEEFPYVFHVQVINVPTSPADFLLAESTAGSELPRLNADQQSLAKALGIPQHDYARGELAKRYSEDRYRFYAERCWDFLVEAGTSQSTDAIGVVYDVSSGKFYCEIRWDGPVRRFVLNAQIIWEPLEAGDNLGLDKARDAVRFAVQQALTPRAGFVGAEVKQ